ncbi:MAG TPA: hypothetical protein PKW35_05640 [Nannocystaceae bacterium]|nr:hypothetical protein [Nannocystaceae bacterium]
MRTIFAVAVALVMACGDDSTGSGSDSASGSDGSTGTSDSASAGSSGAGSSSDGSGSGSDSASGSGTGSADGCSSMTYWTMGDLESPLMHPGKACLNCHSQQVGEDVANMLAVAGTVYPTAHEPDDCNGVDSSAGAVTVQITTADAKVLTLPVNGAGNFMYDQLEYGPIMFPITAKVLRGGKEMVMASPQMSGDCNSCHTEAGMNGAPGRILAP